MVEPPGADRAVFLWSDVATRLRPQIGSKLNRVNANAAPPLRLAPGMVDATNALMMSPADRNSKGVR